MSVIAPAIAMMAIFLRSLAVAFRHRPVIDAAQAAEWQKIINVDPRSLRQVYAEPKRCLYKDRVLLIDQTPPPRRTKYGDHRR